MEKTLYVTVGAQGSGKSTWLGENTDAVDVCIDDTPGLYVEKPITDMVPATQIRTVYDLMV